MASVETAPKPKQSVHDQILGGYESLTPKELERIEREMGDVALSESAELAGDGAELLPPKVDVDYEGQRALPRGHGEEPLTLPVGNGEQLALPPSKSQEAGPITVGHIDLSHNADRKAYDLAARKIEKMKEENESRFLLHPKRIARTVWGYNLAHRKALTKAREDIRNAQDVNIADDEFNEDARKRYGEAIFDQFFNGPEEAIDNAAGEKREFFAGDDDATKAARDLYVKYAQEGTAEQPAMTDDEFNAKIKEIRTKYMGEKLTETATGEVEQDNYLEAAKAIKGRLEQGEAIDDILEGFQIVRGESRADARTDAHKTRTDKFLDIYEQSRIGSLVPSTFVAAAASLAMFAGTRSLSAAGQLAFIGGGAAAIGVVAGAREHLDITKQRAQMGREKFYGKEFTNDKTSRHDELSKFEHEQVSVDSLLTKLGEHQEKLRGGEVSQATVKAALDDLASIQALKNLSAAKKIDLFDHGVNSDPNKHIDDRMALAVSQSELKVLLNELLKSSDADTQKAFGITEPLAEDDNAANITNAAITNRVKFFEDQRIVDINEKDAAFKSYRRRESIKKGAKVFAFSLAAGTVMQEVYAGFSSEKVGLVEQAWGGNDNPGSSETMLAGFLPNQQANVEHINTQLSQQRITELRAEVNSKGGYLVENHKTTYTPMTEKITAAEYAKAHPGEMRHFENVRAFANNTEQVDFNENGGQLSKGPDGTVRVWDTMSKNGSIDGSDSLNMANQSNNVFTIALKQPDGTHLQKVFEYGQDVDKPWSDMLYEKQDGTWGFKGDGYISWGQSAGDTLNVAASIAGDGGPNTFTIANSIPDIDYNYELHTPAVDLPSDMPTAFWLPGSSRVGVASRPSATAPAAAPPEALVPVAPATERSSRSEPSPEQSSPLVELESPQRQLAREAGWPLLDLQIDVRQNISSDQWKAAAEFIEKSNIVNSNVTDPMEQLRLAVELAEQEGIGAELRGLLDGIYRFNQARSQPNSSPANSTPNEEPVQQQKPGPKPDARSYSGETRVPPSPEVVTKRSEEINKLVDDIAVRPDISSKLSKEQIEAVRKIYLDIVNEFGDLRADSIAKRAYTKVHPDIVGEGKEDVREAIELFRLAIGPKPKPT